MIDFRYHIYSLAAVFLALAVGIVVILLIAEASCHYHSLVNLDRGFRDGRGDQRKLDQACRE